MPTPSYSPGGTICTSWYDRRTGGADSTRTEYYADCRPTAATGTPDTRITTGSTDWAGTSSLLDSNFGDYTDSATAGVTTYFAGPTAGWASPSRSRAAADRSCIERAHSE